MRINQPRSLVLYTLALFGLVAYGGMVSVHLRFGTLRAGHTPETLGWYGLAFGVYLAAIVWVERSSRFSWRLVWGSAVLFRLLLLFTQPTLSDDIYRYIWDGYVSNQRVSPYAYAIDDPALDFLDIPERAQANNSWMASPYLPAAQIVFGTLTRFFPLKAVSFQIAAVIFDLLSAWIIGRLLALAHLPPRRILLYLWNPLVIVETAHSAHIDAWMVLLTLLAVYFTFKGDEGGSRTAPLLGPIFLAMATLTKILPVLLLPVLFWRWGWKRVVLYAAVILGLLLPSGLRAGWGLSGELDGRGLFGALRIYNDQWNFNSGLFHWLEVYLTNAGFEDSNLWAKLIVLGMMVVALFAIFVVARKQNLPEVHNPTWVNLREVGVLRLAIVPFMAYTLLTTTVHPWYILILLAFVPFLPVGDAESAEGQSNQRELTGWMAAAPWIYLSGVLALSYLTYVDPLDYREFEWIRQTEWLPVWVMVGLAATVLAVVWFDNNSWRFSRNK